MVLFSKIPLLGSAKNSSMENRAMPEQINTLFNTNVMNKVFINPKTYSFLYRKATLDTKRPPAYPVIRILRLPPQRLRPLP